MPKLFYHIVTHFDMRGHQIYKHH